MIRTLVVDDEPYLRRSIKLSIENTNPEFSVIAEAGNGEQAYELITELQPDVVFLDIRMPIMDGISLLDKLYINGLHPIRVILSGYSEFEYAKKAIRYGVFDYILKPIHIDQLSVLLSNIAERVNQKSINREYEYLHYVLKGIKPLEPPEKLLLNMQHYTRYFCFYITVGPYMYIKNNQFVPAGASLNFENILSDAQKACSPDGQVWLISGENQNEMLLIIGISDHKGASISRFTSCIRQILERLSVPFTMIYTESETNPEALRETVINLKYASINNIRFGYSSSVAWTEDLSANHAQKLLSDDKINELQTIIRGKRYQDFRDAVRQLLELFSENKIYQYQLKLELIRILEILYEDFLSGEIQDFVDESITNSLFYSDIEEIILQHIDNYSRNYYSDASKDMAVLIREYINEHYDTQLTLKEVATHFHISPSYLSNLFRKAFNESPNEYMLNKRVSRSKELLSVFPPISIKEIAVMTGYTDPFYFSRIFKLSTGMTPSEYRESVSKQ